MKKKQQLSDEELQFENEFLRVKIKLETGASFYEPDYDEIAHFCPEYENQALNDILKFEQAYKHSEHITIYEFIGSPVFKKVEDISESDILSELRCVEDLLAVHNIECDYNSPISYREFYKFITEELFVKVIPNIKITGLVKLFHYEEFHPNHELKSEQNCTTFLNDYFDNDTTQFTQLYKSGKIMNYTELLLFRESFHEIRNLKFEFISFEHNGNKCTRKIHLSFDGVVSQGLPSVHYDSEGIIMLEYQWNWWTVVFMQIPGMVSRSNDKTRGNTDLTD